jgi:TolB-like protein/Tfp pilus assembly protein PilF
MSERRRGGLIERLRERGVLRVAASYVVIAWLVLQIADVVLEPWDPPNWVRRAPLLVALLGFPIALALAWFFELGGGPAHRDTAPDGAVRPTAAGWRRHADIAVISVLAAVVAFVLMRDAGWLGEDARPRAGLESSSLAVLPFAAVGVETDRHVTDGLSDELRNQFSRMQSLVVTARSSSIAFEGQSLDAVTIAGKLAVAALLEGTVARSGGRLQVSVQLIDGRSGKVLWAERYDRPDRDLLGVQAEIAGKVVAAVLPRFSASGQSAPPPPTDDPVAYDLYLLGRQKLREAQDLLWRSEVAASNTGMAQAADLFNSAIASDAKFAQAHASLAAAKLAVAYQRVNEATPAAQAEAMDREVLPDVERSLELDPRNAEAWLVKGNLLRHTFRPGARDAFRKAVELDPSNAEATVALGWTTIASGHVDERHRLAMRALELDPMDVGHHEAAITAAWIMARPDEVRALSARMLELFPDHSRAALLACDALVSVGDLAEALPCVLAVAAKYSGDPAIVAESYSAAGEIAEALGEAPLALELYRRGSGEPLAVLAVQRLEGDVDGLRRAAREALGRRSVPFEAFQADELARAGLVDEAIAVYGHAGLHELWAGDSHRKAFLMHSTLRYLALLKSQGRHAEAQPTLDRVLKQLDDMRRHGARSCGVRIAGAKAFALSGRPDEALEQVVLAADTPDALDAFVWIQDDAAFAELARDPRVAAPFTRLREEQARQRARLSESFKRHGLPWPPQ